MNGGKSDREFSFCRVFNRYKFIKKAPFS